MTNASDTGSVKKTRFLRMPTEVLRTIAIIFVWRMVPIAVLMLLTVNPWKYSYYHWGVSWAEFAWAKLPALTSDEQFRLGAFELAVIVSALTLVALFNPRTTWLKLTLGQFVGYRLLPIAIIVVAGYFWTLPQFFVWKARLYDAGAWHMEGLQRVEFAAFLLIGLCALAWWIYVFRKSWHELGSSRFAVALALAVLAAVVYFMYELHMLPSSWKNIAGVVEVLFGLGVGFCFSLALLDRKLSWTFATTAVVTDVHEEAPNALEPSDDDFHEVGSGGGQR